jgi:hypothetical protein
MIKQSNILSRKRKVTKMKSKVFTFSFILAVVQIIAVSYVSAQEEPTQKDRPTIELEGRYWWPALSGSVKAVSADIGSGVNFKDDLGIKDEGIPEGRIIWYPGPNSWLRLSYLQVSYEGENRLERTIDFQGKHFTVGTDIESNADLKYATVGWAWQFINLADGKIKLGTLIEASLVNADYSIKRTDGLIEAAHSYTVPLPAIGLSLNVAPLKGMEGFLDLSGLPLGKYGHTFNVEGGLKVIPIKNVSVLCGYRYSDIDYENDPDFFKLRFSGPFIAATLKF